MARKASRKRPGGYLKENHRGDLVPTLKGHYANVHGHISRGLDHVPGLNRVRFAHVMRKARRASRKRGKR